MLQERNIVNCEQLEDTVGLCVENNFSLLVKGKLGFGKTSICVQGGINAGIKKQNIIIESPHVKEVTDYCGLPFAIKDEGKTRADFLPINTMERILFTKEPLLVILDEIDKANRTMNVIAQIIWGREINNHKIPDHVRFVATCNLEEEQTGSYPIKPHLLDRFWSVVEYQIDVEGWSKYMLNKYQTKALMLTTFIRYQPHYLTQGQDTELALQKIKSTTPRTLENYLIMEIEAEKKGKNYDPLLYGVCGTAFKIEYDAFKDLYLSDSIPLFEEVVTNPKKAKIPSQPAQINLRYVVVSMLSSKVTEQTFEKVTDYLLRKEWSSFRSLRRVFLENVKQLQPELLQKHPKAVVDLIGE